MILKDKVCIVTGASYGLSRGIAKAFITEGAKLAVSDYSFASVNNLVTKLKKQGANVIGVSADLTEAKQCKDMFETVVEHFGQVDVLVNNAGIRRDVSLVQLSKVEWDRAIEMNLGSCFNCVMCAKEYMIQSRYGKIVNIAGDLSSLFSVWQCHYVAAGYGIQGFTKALALELGPYNINVNCVIPDFIDSEMTRIIGRIHGMYMDEVRKTAQSLVPLKRLGNVQDVANLCLFLSSDSSGFITGQSIRIDGGAKS